MKVSWTLSLSKIFFTFAMTLLVQTGHAQNGGLFIVSRNGPNAVDEVSLVSATNAAEAAGVFESLILKFNENYLDKRDRWTVLGGCPGSGWGAVVQHIDGYRKNHFGWTCGATSAAEAIRAAWKKCDESGTKCSGTNNDMLVSVGRGAPKLSNAEYSDLPKMRFTQSREWGYIYDLVPQFGIMNGPEDVIPYLNKKPPNSRRPFFWNTRNSNCILNTDWNSISGEGACTDPTYGR